ncbi:hypothetical protein AYI70_g2887 [Smittium culicis]|uniref:Uncharacterized protein n=1 Tax=Smittium culicis TaxID=133412 RepID=A0A1R1Y6J1_9FUNG|nr:hypothetical protein AYI70_g2887 [Smittium culicis]
MLKKKKSLIRFRNSTFSQCNEFLKALLQPKPHYQLTLLLRNKAAKSPLQKPEFLHNGTATAYTRLDIESPRSRYHSAIWDAIYKYM